MHSDEGCNFVTANCNSTSFPLACTSCCGELLYIECTYDHQAIVSNHTATSDMCMLHLRHVNVVTYDVGVL